jgi:hypothetical protein
MNLSFSDLTKQALSISNIEKDLAEINSDIQYKKEISKFSKKIDVVMISYKNYTFTVLEESLIYKDFIKFEVIKKTTAVINSKYSFKKYSDINKFVPYKEKRYDNNSGKNTNDYYNYLCSIEVQTI